MRFPYRGAGIGLVKDNCILMGKRADTPFFGKWAVPGGGFEKDRDLDDLENAKREFKEETGIDFDSLDAKQISSWTLKAPFFRWTTYFFSVKELDFDSIKPDEFSEIQWVSIDEVLGKTRKGEKKHFRPFTKSEVRSINNSI